MSPKSGARERRALAGAILGLVGHGGTARDLLGRLAAQRATLTADDAERVLEELGSLGLVRIVSAEGDRRYALTSLGRQTLDASVGGDTLAGQLAELERLRSDLLSTVSHELRTPLTAVRTCAGLLLDPNTHPTGDETRQLLETIARNADRMQRLVTDVLDLARYRTGNVPLQRRRFDAREVAESAASGVQPLALERGQTIWVLTPPDAVWVYGDHRRIEQALLNLVSNAGKYSPENTTIRIAVERQDGHVRWEVADEGPGISAEDQRHLFERFFVGRNDTTRSGVGLGLPTALAIAQAHGGGIDVESAPGRGSRFTLRVPAESFSGDDG